MLHQAATVSDGIHIIHAWTVADAAALAALSVSASDVGKVALQNDIKQFYVLTNATGPIWVPIALVSTDELVEGSTNLYHTAARVLGQVLTGLSTAAGTVVAATHTVLEAIGFLQKQVSDLSITVGEHTGSIKVI